MSTGTPSPRPAPATARESTQDAFEFVKALAAELSGGTVSIPSFPEVAMRLQRLLGDENADAERIVRLLGAEPALAARVVGMANSAALNPAGQRVTDLRAAVTRMGFDALRSAAIAFAVAQLRGAEQFRAIEKPLARLWRRSVEMAALCRVIARRHRELGADAALLVGLLHGVGKLYILTRAARHPRLFADQAAFQGIVRDWHADITKALLENWKIDDELVEAIHGYEDPERVGRGPLSLSDVLAVADLFASLRERPEVLEMRLAECYSATRLGIDAAAIAQVLEECNAEMTALRDALGQ
ncbi:MAG: HDOD domain-containing protein [Steroidobacteraceae bacterium]|jgi:HD-like signal output (HDOD) protein|nr:HDOD domain-containing protein [Steroidobacteraceae bacterium]